MGLLPIRLKRDPGIQYSKRRLEAGGVQASSSLALNEMVRGVSRSSNATS